MQEKGEGSLFVNGRMADGRGRDRKGRERRSECDALSGCQVRLLLALPQRMTRNCGIWDGRLLYSTQIMQIFLHEVV